MKLSIKSWIVFPYEDPNLSGNSKLDKLWQLFLTHTHTESEREEKIRGPKFVFKVPKTVGVCVCGLNL